MDKKLYFIANEGCDATTCGIARISDEEFKEKIKNIPTQIIVYNEEQIKSEAVKEFAERFLKKIHENHYLLSDKHNSTDKGMFTIGIEQAVKETEKEMVGE